jgi:hypothetical protein
VGMLRPKKLVCFLFVLARVDRTMLWNLLSSTITAPVGSPGKRQTKCCYLNATRRVEHTIRVSCFDACAFCATCGGVKRLSRLGPNAVVVAFCFETSFFSKTCDLCQCGD